MGNHGQTRIRLRVALGSGLAVIALGGLSATSAHAGTMTFVPSEGEGTNWTTQLDPDGYTDPNVLPGGFSISDDTDNGPSEPDYRAHSDVPDLPDGPDPSATSLYVPPSVPNLSDAYPKTYFAPAYSTVPADGLGGGLGLSPGSSGLAAPVTSPIPEPGVVLLFGAAGLGGLARRRRR